MDLSFGTEKWLVVSYINPCPHYSLLLYNSWVITSFFQLVVQMLPNPGPIRLPPAFSIKHSVEEWAPFERGYWKVFILYLFAPHHQSQPVVVGSNLRRNCFIRNKREYWRVDSIKRKILKGIYNARSKVNWAVDYTSRIIFYRVYIQLPCVRLRCSPVNGRWLSMLINQSRLRIIVRKNFEISNGNS